MDAPAPRQELPQADIYARLGVPRTATTQEVATAYRKAALAVHPDRNPGPEAARKFAELHEAYKVLSDESLRRSYDRRFNTSSSQRPSQKRKASNSYGAPWKRHKPFANTVYDMSAMPSRPTKGFVPASKPTHASEVKKEVNKMKRYMEEAEAKRLKEECTQQAMRERQRAEAATRKSLKQKLDKLRKAKEAREAAAQHGHYS